MVLSRSRLAALLTATALVVASCGDGDGDGESAGAEDGRYVVATTTIWADIAGTVACDGTFAVRSLVPPGGDAHAYEPSLRDREVLDGAAVVVANGAGLEELLEDTLQAVEDGGVEVLRVAEAVSGTDGDPHVWFDPTLVRAALALVGDALVDAGADRTAIDACVTAADAELMALDEEIEQILAAIPDHRRILVTNHDSLGPFAGRYGFEILGTVLPSASTLTEASPGELEALAQRITELELPAIFTETLHASTDAEALGERLGIDVVELHTDSLGEPGSGVETYADLLRTDAELIAAALGP